MSYNQLLLCLSLQPAIIIIMIKDFHRDASLKENFRATLTMSTAPLLWSDWLQIQRVLSNIGDYVL